MSHRGKRDHEHVPTELVDLKAKLVSSQLDPASLALYYDQICNSLSLSEALETTLAKLDIISVILLKLTKLRSSAVQVDLCLLQFIFVNLDRSNKSLMNYAITNLSNKLVEYLKLFEDYETILLDWLDHLLKWYNNTKQVLVLIESLLKHLHGSMLQFSRSYPWFMAKLMDNLKLDALANSSAKVLMVVYKELFNQVPATEWFDLWSEDFYHHLSTEKYTKNDLIYWAPPLFKTHPPCLEMLLKKYFNDEMSYNFTNEYKFNLLINLSKIGQDLSVLSSVLTPQFYTKSLSNYNISIRLSALNLLCYSQKSSQTIPIETYALIKDNLFHILADTNTIDFRNELINTLSTLITRVRDSNYNLHKQSKDQTQGIEFMAWFVWFLTDTLSPVNMYSQQITGLSLLTKLIDMDLDSFHPKKQNNKFPFSVEIFTPLLIKYLFDNINNDFEDIRKASAEMLFKCPDHLLAPILENEAGGLIEKGIDLCFNLNARKSEGGSYCFQVLVFCYYKTNSTKVHEIFDRLMEFVMRGRTLVIDSEVPREYRIHGVFNALRFMIEVLPKTFFEEKSEYWTDYFKEIVAVNELVWTQIKPVIGNQETDTEADEDDKVAVTFSWKFIKESTHLITNILRIDPSIDPLKYLDLLAEQISVIKHKGAFSSIYPCFISVTSYCLSNPATEAYPKELLHKNIQLIGTKHQLITRRSGGLPFLLTGILTSYKSRHGQCKALTRETFDCLFDIINNTEEETSKENNFDLPQVNGLNCIKSIINDSQLSAETGQYLIGCLTLCLSHFNNTNWSIKNCALMLFTSVRGRLINSSTLLSVNFFTDSVQAEFEKYLKSKNPEVVFAVLSILSKLNFVNDEKRLGQFKVILVDLLASRSWKIREMAARTFANIIQPSLYQETVIELGKQLGRNQNSNLNHGLFLSVLEVVKKLESPKSVQEMLLSLNNITDWSVLKTYVEILKTLEVPRAVYLQLSALFAENVAVQFDGIKKLAMNELLEFLIQFELDNNLENLSDLLELCIGMNYDFSVIALKAIGKHKIKIDSGIIWRELLQPHFQDLTIRYLDVLTLTEADHELSGEEFSTLTKFIGQAPEINSKALEVLSQYKPKTVEEEYFDLVAQLSESTDPVRRNCLMATINILQSNQCSVKWWFNLYYFLTDSSEELRGVSAGFFSKTLGLDYKKPSYILISDFNGFLIEKFEKETIEKELKNHICFSLDSYKEPGSMDIGNGEKEDLLTSHEDPRSYRNDIAITRNLIAMAKMLNPTSSFIEQLLATKRLETKALIDLLKTYEYDGLMGCSRFNHIFTASSIETLMLEYLALVSKQSDLEQTQTLLGQMLGFHLY